MREQIWSVSSLVRYLKNSLDHDINIQSILLKGEISNFTHHRSGHMYFSLKDKDAKMNCVMWASHATRMKIIPKEGMQVIVSAKVSMYEPQGSIQLYVFNMQSDGIGDLYLQFEELKKKMLHAGYFEEAHKKPIPQYPKSIGVISAKSGAAIQDVLSIIERRWPLCEVVLYPSLVQGEEASVHLIDALHKSDKAGHDVILLVRGGGSIEDLWCFNNEQLAYTIYDMHTCIVTGVGHETDTTLVDFVADKRAPTPSAAAELVTPDIYEVKESFSLWKMRLIKCIDHMIKEKSTRVAYYKSHRLFTNPEAYIQNDRMRIMMAAKSLSSLKMHTDIRKEHLSQKQEQLYIAINSLIEKNREKLHKNIYLLDAYSPLKILERGYSITFNKNKTVKQVNDVKEKDKITTRVNDGFIISEVVERKYIK